MIKKAFRILVAITIVFVLTALPVSAQTLTPVCNDVHTSDFSIRGPVCPNCDHGSLIERTIYSSWSNTGN